MRHILYLASLLLLFSAIYVPVTAFDIRSVTSEHELLCATENTIWYNGSIWNRKKGVAETNHGTIIALSQGSYYERSFSGPVHIAWFDAIDQDGLVNPVALKQAIAAATLAKERLSFGPGTYKFDQPIYLESNLTVEGAGQEQTIFTVTPNFSDNRLIIGNGCSNIVLKDFTITGTSKEMDAGIRLNSYPNKCFNILINQITIRDFLGSGIVLGGAGPNDPLHFNSDVWITNCIFRNIGDPKKLYITNDTDKRFNAINLNQTTKRAMVRDNVFERIAGDGVFGWNYYFLSDPENSSLQIKDNFFSNCWMGIELTGSGAVSNLSQIIGNLILFPTRIGGYGISVAGDHTTVSNNTIVTVERSAMEVALRWGTITENKIHIQVAKGTSKELSVLKNSDLIEVSAIESYNTGNSIKNNNIRFDPIYDDNSLSNIRFRGIKLVRLNHSQDATQPLASYNYIMGNYIYGNTGAWIAATNNAFERVMIEGNNFVSPYLYEAGIILQGYNWLIKRNTFDLTGNSRKGALIECSSLQVGVSRSSITDNDISSKYWSIPDSKQYSLSNTRYIDPDSGIIQK